MDPIEKLASEHYPEYYSIGLGNDKIGFERGYNLGISSQTEISDEEIEKKAQEYAISSIDNDPIRILSWISACEWYREQLNLKLK